MLLFRKINFQFWLVAIAIVLSRPCFSSAAEERVIESDQPKLIMDFFAGLNIPDGDSLNLIYTGDVTSPSALLRDTSGNPSYWGGTFWSNYSVLFVNPNGISFGSQANIQAASFIASTLNIANQDFLNGRYNFYKETGSNGYIVNKGRISTNVPGGYICLLSPAIDNQYIIEADLGTVVLASAEKMTLALDDLSGISVVIDEAVKDEVLGIDGQKMESAIKNSGSISANGGKVILTAKVLNNVFDYAINNTGIIEAQSLVDNDGVVELVAEGAPVINIAKLEGGRVNIEVKDSQFINRGQIISDGVGALVNGGRIFIDATRILQQGRISANALEEGTAGEINIVSQEETSLDNGSVTEARALGLAGNGGRIVINSRGGNTLVNNNAVIDVSAGSVSGNAGYIEVGAFVQLGFYGVLNGRAPPGYTNATIIFKNNPNQAQPAVSTDEADYPPDSTPIISGSGFAPNTEVTIIITEPTGTPITLTTTTDSAGNFALTYQPAFLIRDGFYVVSVTDGLKSAATSFTDAVSNKITTVSVSDLTPDWSQQGALKIPILEFTVKSSRSGGDKLQKLDVTYTGTNKADIKTVYLYRESAGSGGSFDPATDILLAQDSTPSGSVFTLNPNPDFAMTKDTEYQFYIVVDLEPTVAENRVIDAKIAKQDIDFQSGTWPKAADVNIWDPPGETIIDNTAPTPAAPTTTGTLGNNGYYTSPSVSVSPSAGSDAISGFAKNEYSADAGATWQDYTSSLTLTGDGGHDFLYRAVDNAGNASSPQTYSVNIDSNLPTLNITLPTNDATYYAPQILLYTASDNLTPNPSLDIVGPASGTIYNIPGAHSIVLTATDLAGNSRERLLTFTIEMANYTKSQLSNSLTPRLLLPNAQEVGEFQFNPFIPVGPVFLYQPLTPMDMSAFNEFILEEDAYEFIEGRINIIGHDALSLFLRKDRF